MGVGGGVISLQANRLYCLQQVFRIARGFAKTTFLTAGRALCHLFEERDT